MRETEAHRQEAGFWTSGPRAVREALAAGRVSKVYVQVGSGEAVRVAKEARAAGIPVEIVPREALARLAGSHHQGVVARLRPVPALALDGFLERAFRGADPVMVVLDHLEDPMNVGAIARSVEAMGAFGLVLPKRRQAGLGSGALRASAGALAHLPVTEVGNIAQVLEKVKARGAWVVAADPKGGDVAGEVDLTGPLALVVGAEEKGVSRLVLERADFRVRIETGGKTASLNASVAAGILLYEIMRQRADRVRS